ncbi:MAG: hypothetical protein E2O68_02380 [Deltaproteobacteria bacterium]|nr:MAG: hypothetical protein E2O68_02380 [Deltaproteobacteria bacterium]
MMERITSKKYRFSILRFIYILDTLLRSIKLVNHPKIAWVVVRLAPFLVGEAMVVVTNLNKALYPLLGVVAAESIIFIRGRVIGLVND